MFIPGNTYSRRNIFATIGIPEDTWGGNWFTGYNEHQGAFYIFTNVGVPGRTGHDYGNKWVGDQLKWYAKTGTRLAQPQIQRLTAPSTPVHVFWRASNEEDFTYAGAASAVAIVDSSPVEIRWEFATPEGSPITLDPDEVPRGTYSEGATRQVTVNAHERNPAARRECLRHYGSRCSVCGFQFEDKYGEIGSGYIHVHHLVPLGGLSQEYEVDPIRDLRPVCPNCHAMLHRTNPPMELADLKKRLLPRPAA